MTEQLDRRALYAERGRALRHRVRARLSAKPQPGGLRFGPTPPTPPPLVRDVNQALAFLRSPETAADGGGPNRRFAEERATMAEGMRSTTLAGRVAATTWYHTIELPGGITTPGFYDHRPLVARYGLPASLRGRRVLDVGTFDGFWAFELERRGATVTAVDLPSSLDIDIPPPAMARARSEAIAVEIGTAFGIAADALGSSVDRRERSVYDLDPESLGTFDLVHMGDLLLHLERPLEALRSIRSVTDGELHLSDAYDPTLAGSTVRYLGGWRDAEWWIPSLRTLCQWLSDAGYADVRVLSSYQINTRHSASGGLWRAVIRATAR